MKTFPVVDLCEPKVLSNVTLLLLWIAKSKKSSTNAIVVLWMARGHSRPQQPLHQPPLPTSFDILDSLTKAAPRELQASTPITPLRLTPLKFTFEPISTALPKWKFNFFFFSFLHLNLLKFFWSWGFWKILLGWYDLVLNEFLYFKARGWALEFLRPYFSLLHFRVCFILARGAG